MNNSNSNSNLPQPPSPTLESYRQKLATHDWYYSFSEDYSVYCRGRQERNELVRLRHEHDPDWTLWNAAAPADFQHIPPIAAKAY